MNGLQSTERLWVLLAQADVLRALGETEGAASYQEQARTLVRERAGRISDAALREGFLRDGPECARALE